MYYRLYSLVIYKEIERKLRKQGKERESNTKTFSRQFFVFGPPIAADAFVVARHFPISRFAIFASVFPPHPLSTIVYLEKFRTYVRKYFVTNCVSFSLQNKNTFQIELTAICQTRFKCVTNVCCVSNFCATTKIKNKKNEQYDCNRNNLNVAKTSHNSNANYI